MKYVTHNQVATLAQINTVPPAFRLLFFCCGQGVSERVCVCIFPKLIFLLAHSSSHQHNESGNQSN